ncbi:anti-sigma factor family protein [Calidifontibacillus erzurumensis]|uniref:Anti-sigma factor n=1 Tax=Calidifontibacillus erzurumensis TaxID=2741433 RepID=A0A8J8KCQ6_9BACI|nr:anti-sigma factor [Calidifontibacillus erzurumensis]NSL53334.1 anti-sigma factor [Calidifontibacillus erzurumensis]
MKCSQSYVELMHKYLDEEIGVEEEKQLKNHLNECSSCLNHFQELEKAIAFVQSTTHIHAPLNFTNSVMNRLPKEKRLVVYRRFFKKHPVFVAAAVFLLLMTGSIFSTWNSNTQLSVSKQSNLKIQDHTVIVPKGEIVEGDVIVRNGDIKIEGVVRGDVIVINGDQYLASAGHVTGEIMVINEVFDWMWYKTKHFFSSLFK